MVGYLPKFNMNGKSVYENVTTPQYVNAQFTVAPANGLGITSLKSNGYVRNVFMHTSTTPAANDGYTNPNPLAGYAMVQFRNSFNYYLSGIAQFIAPQDGSDVKIDNSALTVGQVYVITTLGNATAAKWLAIGVPAGVTPAVGVAFVALTNGGAGNTLTSKVQLPSSSGISSVEVLGLPSTMINQSMASTYGGAWMYLAFRSLSASGTISAPTFTGSALANHTHDILYKNAAVADGATTRVNVGTNLLGANTGSDITVAGAGANGGVRNASAGTPAGTISAPTFTGSASAIAAPTTGTIVCLKFMFDGSSATIDGI